MKKWTAEDVETIKADYLTTPIAVLAERMGRSRPSVYIKAQELKLVKKARKPKETHEPVAAA